MLAISCFVCLAITPLMWLYSILGFAYAPTRWRKYLPFYVLTIFVCAYSYDPVAIIDLTGYFESVETCSKVTFIDVLNIYGDGLVIRNIFFWIIGKMGLPHLLPAITTSIVYGISSYITCKTADKFDADEWIFSVLLFQMMLLPFNSIVSNIRNICAFSLIVLGVFLEFIEGKPFWKVLPLYVIPCFYHVSSIILVLLRIVIPWARKKVVPISLGVILVPFVIQFLYKRISFISFSGYLGDSIRLLIRKLYSYMTVFSETAERVLNSGYYSATKAVMLPCLIVLIFMIILLRKEKIEKDEKNRDFTNYVLFICLLAVVSGVIFIVPNYWRMACAAIVGYPIVLIPLLKQANRRFSVLTTSLGFVACFMGLRFILDIYRGFQNVEPSEFIVLMLENNVYSILLQFFRSILFIPI